MIPIDSHTNSMFAKPQTPSTIAFIALAVVMFSACIASPAWAQRARHRLIRGNEAPGLAAQKMILGHPELANFPQPVEILSPEGSTISVASNGGFGEAVKGEIKARLLIGSVYRFKIGNLPEELDLPPGTLLYPSIELVDRLYPPKGLEEQFPVQIILTKDDLTQAAQGKLVTKVVYLEDPSTALPIRQVTGNQSTIDIGVSADPFNTADQLGRPMAIIRIGSRVPLATDLQGEFRFNSPRPEVLGTKPLTQVAPPRIDPPPRMEPPPRIDPLPRATNPQSTLTENGATTANPPIQQTSSTKTPPIISGDVLRKEAQAKKK